MRIVPLESSGYVTPKDYSKFVKFHALRGKYYRVKSRGIIALLLGATILLFYFGFVYAMKSLWIIGGIILLCMLMFVYTINTNVKRICNSNAKTVRAKQETVFGTNGFIFDLIMKNPEENEHDEIFYDELERIYLARTAMYIYIEKRSVIIVPIRNLKVTPSEALAFLQKYVPAEKLVICK